MRFTETQNAAGIKFYCATAVEQRMANGLLLVVALVVLSASESAARYEGLRPTRSYIKRQLKRDSGELEHVQSEQNFSGDSDLSPLLPMPPYNGAEDSYLSPFPDSGAADSCRVHFQPNLQTIIDTEHSNQECTGGRVSFDDCCQVKFVSDKTGVYRIAGHLSWCDMSTDSGGWQVILRRADGKRSFVKKWSRYRAGFGFLNKDFWMGLDTMHELTTNTEMQLRVDLRYANGTELFALYHKFSVAGPSDNYRLTIGEYDNNSTIVDSFSHHDQMQFTTVDRDNDLFRPNRPHSNCAGRETGGWWFRHCAFVHLTPDYHFCPFGPTRPCRTGVFWFRSSNFINKSHFTWVEMKIRPAKTWRCGNSEPQGSVESYFLKSIIV